MTTPAKPFHLLQIGFGFQQEAQRYQKLLRGEFVSGIPITVTVLLTSITSPFPGGVLAIKYATHGSSPAPLAIARLAGADGSPIVIPVINPSETKPVYSGTIFPLLEGFSWFHVSVQSVDQVPVLLRRASGEPGSPRTDHLLSVVSRIELELILAVQGGR